jgi:hypothetical protein
MPQLRQQPGMQLVVSNQSSKNKSSKAKSSIAETRQVKQLQQDLSNFKTLVSVYQVLRPLGLRSDLLDNVKKDFDRAEEDCDKLLALLNDFHHHFSPCGWIVHESLNVEKAKKALSILANDGLRKAEEYLADEWDDQAIEFLTLWFTPIEEFHQRATQMQWAREDYLAGRYYSCIPLLLIIIDGLVNDLFKDKGFFAEGVTLEAWDSVAGHSEGLNRLAELFRTSRTRTTTDEITIPFRHGILHGRDINYANRIVAAKLWAALQAIADLARARLTEDRRMKESKVLLAEMTLDEQSEYAKHSLESIKNYLSWRARPKDVLQGIVERGDFREGTPEFSLVEFLQAWRAGNYGRMAQFLKPSDKFLTLKARAGDIRQDFAGYNLSSYQISDVEDACSTMSIVSAELEIQHDTEKHGIYHRFFVNHVDANFEGMAPGMKGGRWIVDDLVFPWVMFRGESPFMRDRTIKITSTVLACPEREQTGSVNEQ